MYAYSALLAVGAVMGALKGSQASLIAGGGSALAMASIEYFAGTSRAGSVAQLLLSGGLAYMMGSRFLAGGKFMPGGAIATASTIAVLAVASRFLDRKVHNQ